MEDGAAHLPGRRRRGSGRDEQQPWPRRGEREQERAERAARPVLTAPPVGWGPPDPPPRRWTGPLRARTLGCALLITVAATVAPGAGHLILRRRRTGALLLGAFLLGIGSVVVLGAVLSRSELLELLLSDRVLVVAVLTCAAVAVAWIAVVVRTYLLAAPPGLGAGRRILGAAVVTALCVVVAAPLGFGANLANSQADLLDTLFPSGDPSAAEVIRKPRLNILLLGSDAGPDRTGVRTDTMMVASIDTRTGRTILFGLPRNIGYAQFPPGSAMAAEFPDGFHDSGSPHSGDFLLNAVYGYGHAHPELAPPGPTRDPGLNLLQSSISYMLGLQVDYYLELDMAGFAAIVDALGGVRVDVGPEPIPIGGITPSGREVPPDGYIPPGVQQLSGEQALAFARSRTGSSDYVRMGRQRCLLQYVLDQKSPTDLLANFQEIARATTDSVATNIPREIVPALVSLAGDAQAHALQSVSFDPNLPDPDEPDGRFNPGRPDFAHMRQVVRAAITRDPATAPPTPPAAALPVPPGPVAGSAAAAPATTGPTSVARSC